MYLLFRQEGNTFNMFWSFENMTYFPQCCIIYAEFRSFGAEMLLTAISFLDISGL